MNSLKIATPTVSLLLPLLLLALTACDSSSDPANVDGGTPSSDSGVNTNDANDSDANGGEFDAGNQLPDATPADPSEFQFVVIPSGVFTMGCLQGRDDVGNNAAVCGVPADTVREVTLSRGFSMSKSEVTQEQFEAIAGFNPSDYSEVACESCPVQSMGWNVAAWFTNMLSADQSLSECYTCTGDPTAIPSTLSCQRPSDPYACTGFRLPTDAEWEWASRGGESFPYAGAAQPETVSWYERNSESSDFTQPWIPRKVCTKTENAYGLCDMTGNVSEWISDTYSSRQTETVTDPVFASGGTTYRGGYYSLGTTGVQGNRLQIATSYGIAGSQNSAGNFIGFRVVRTMP